MWTVDVYVVIREDGAIKNVKEVFGTYTEAAKYLVNSEEKAGNTPINYYIKKALLVIDD